MPRLLFTQESDSPAITLSLQSDPLADRAAKHYTLGEKIMSSENDTQKDWFDWAGAFLADCKIHAVEWHESFSPQAEQVLKLATQAALSLKHEAVGAEHLLAGLLKLHSGYTAAALRRTGLTLPSLREEIESERGVSEQNMVRQPLPYTPRCTAIIQRARARIRGLDNARVEAEDLLLELLAEKDGLPARIFCKRAINTEEIKNAVMTKAHEQAFVSTFVVPEKRARYMEFLPLPKRRAEITNRFCHLFDFIPSLAKQIPRGTAAGLATMLRTQGASDTAYIIGGRDEIDGQDLPLEQAVDSALADSNGVVVSCVPGRLALYIQEFPPGDTFILSHQP